MTNRFPDVCPGHGEILKESISHKSFKSHDEAFSLTCFGRELGELGCSSYRKAIIRRDHLPDVE